jgi:A/G-specific adenine glycosylase
VEETLPDEGCRDWYYALMDYGAALKRSVENPNRRSKHYARQSRFEGSPRQARGAIVRALTAHGKADVDLIVADSV